MRHPSLKILVLLISLLACSAAWCSNVESILKMTETPSGVVFEIVSDEDGLLSQLLPTIKTDIKRLRNRFPGLPVAIVTHGTEQFDLTSNNRDKEPTAHKLVEEMVNSDNVDVHVCGTHAGWYGVSPEDFPDYVDVTAAGPAQINDYEEMGYELIVLTD